MANPSTNTNPDLVDIADEAFGVGLPTQIPDFKQVPASASVNNKIEKGGDKRPDVVTQEISVTAASASTNNVDGGASSGKKTVVDQEITTGPAQTANTSINGGTFSPTSPNVTNTSQNNVVGQTYGKGSPTNVNV